MHHAVCAECGNDCEVPFRPTGDRPIYCKNCFGGKGGDDRAPRQDRPSFDRGAAPSHGSDKAVRELSQKVDAIAQKLDALIALFDDMTVAEVEGDDAAPVTEAAEAPKKAAKKNKKSKK
jgi:CxxC-x17-CxxC domain-containing protein